MHSINQYNYYFNCRWSSPSQLNQEMHFLLIAMVFFYRRYSLFAPFCSLSPPRVSFLPAQYLYMGGCGATKFRSRDTGSVGNRQICGPSSAVLCDGPQWTYHDARHQHDTPAILNGTTRYIYLKYITLLYLIVYYPLHDYIIFMAF